MQLALQKWKLFFKDWLQINPEEKKTAVSPPLYVTMRHSNITCNDFVFLRNRRIVLYLKNALFHQSPSQGLNEMVQSIHVLSAGVASLVVLVDMYQMPTM